MAKIVEKENEIVIELCEEEEIIIEKENKIIRIKNKKLKNVKK